MVTENRVLGRIAGLRMGEVTGGWSKLHKKIADCCSLPGIIKVIRSRKMGWLRHVACVGKNKNAYRVLVGKLEGKRPLGRPVH
jgi:hypothetical protein